MPSIDFVRFLSNQNVKAFLRLIRQGESNQDDSAYTLLYGGGHFEGFADHPRKFFQLPDGRRTSAAGAYQITATTWDALVKQFGFPNFEPATQDCAAVALVAGRKALADGVAGNIGEAIRKCRPEWTSLPGASEQNQTYDKAIAVYRAWGGQDTPSEAAVTQPVPLVASPAPAKKGTSMPILALVSAFGPIIADLIPQLTKFFAPGTEVAQRNLGAATAVFDTIVKASGQPNIQAAVEAMQKDPTLTAQVTQAVVTDPVIIGLIEVGGGIEKARERMADPNQIPFYKNPAVIVTVLLVPLVYMVAVSVLFGVGGQTFSDEVKMMVITAIVSGLLGSITGFFLGSSLGSQRKTEIAGAANAP